MWTSPIPSWVLPAWNVQRTGRSNQLSLCNQNDKMMMELSDWSLYHSINLILVWMQLRIWEQEQTIVWVRKLQVVRHKQRSTIVLTFLSSQLRTSNSARDGASARLRNAAFISSCVKHMINRRCGTISRQFDPPPLVLPPPLSSEPPPPAPARLEGNTCCSNALLRSICFSLRVSAIKNVMSAWTLIGWLSSHSIWRVLGQLTGQGKGEIVKRDALRTISVT